MTVAQIARAWSLARQSVQRIADLLEPRRARRLRGQSGAPPREARAPHSARAATLAKIQKAQRRGPTTSPGACRRTTSGR